MSLDYPFYQELRRQKHRAAAWWLLGDRLYYFGLLSCFVSILGGAALLLGLFAQRWSNLLLALCGVVVGAVAWYLGLFCKAYARALAERDGISAAEVYARLGRQQAPPQ